MSLLYTVNGSRSSENRFTLPNKAVEEELDSQDVLLLVPWADVSFDENNELNYLCKACQGNQYAFAQLSLNKEAEIDVLNNHGQGYHEPDDIINSILVDAENGNSYDNMDSGSSPSLSVSMSGHDTASFKQIDTRAFRKQIPIQSPMFCMS